MAQSKKQPNPTEDKKGNDLSSSYVDIFTAARDNDVGTLDGALRRFHVNVKDENGMTPLHYAAGGLADKSIERLLREPGIDPTIEDNFGRRASMVALELRSRGVAVARMLRPYCYPTLDA